MNRIIIAFAICAAVVAEPPSGGYGGGAPIAAFGGSSAGGVSGGSSASISSSGNDGPLEGSSIVDQALLTRIGQILSQQVVSQNAALSSGSSSG
ncbi:unnamed protein product, partial [Allacma fusca]